MFSGSGRTISETHSFVRNLDLTFRGCPSLPEVDHEILDVLKPELGFVQLLSIKRLREAPALHQIRLKFRGTHGCKTALTTVDPTKGFETDSCLLFGPRTILAFDSFTLTDTCRRGTFSAQQRRLHSLEHSLYRPASQPHPSSTQAAYEPGCAATSSRNRKTAPPNP